MCERGEQVPTPTPTVAEPRKDLPSTAITPISFGFTARSAVQAPRMRSRPLASILLMVRRNVDSHRTSPVTPSFANTAGLAAAAHSAMAANERAPAMTAHAAIARIPTSPCRSPRGLPGIGHSVQRGQQGRRRFRYVGELALVELVNDGVRGR